MIFYMTDVADWGGATSVCCNAGPMFVSAGNGWPCDAPGIIGSCQSAAASKIVKALPVTSPTHVSSAIASSRPLPFYRLHFVICPIASVCLSSLLRSQSLGDTFIEFAMVDNPGFAVGISTLSVIIQEI